METSSVVIPTQIVSIQSIYHIYSYHTMTLYPVILRCVDVERTRFECECGASAYKSAIKINTIFYLDAICDSWWVLSKGNVNNECRPTGSKKVYELIQSLLAQSTTTYLRYYKGVGGGGGDFSVYRRIVFIQIIFFSLWNLCGPSIIHVWY